MTTLNPYLGFLGEARQAMEFYQSVFGGKLTFSTFAEFQVSDDPAEQDKIMHGQLEGAGGLVLMGADAPNSMERTTGSSIQLSLSGGPEDDAELRGYWAKLSDGATIGEELAAAPWGDTFGMLTDKFGTRWMVNIAGAGAGAGAGA